MIGWAIGVVFRCSGRVFARLSLCFVVQDAVDRVHRSVEVEVEVESDVKVQGYRPR